MSLVRPKEKGPKNSRCTAWLLGELDGEVIPLAGEAAAKAPETEMPSGQHVTFDTCRSSNTPVIAVNKHNVLRQSLEGSVMSPMSDRMSSPTKEALQVGLFSGQWTVDKRSSDIV